MISVPTDLRQISNDVLGITWDDGHESHYTWLHLRDACPCAWCEAARAQGNPVNTDLNPRPTMVHPVGNYAFSFEWEDGHTVGIYSYDYLRLICLCGQVDHKAEWDASRASAQRVL
jgi:DUF971 family protein